MKRQAREATPIWVWMTFALMGVGIAAYLISYLMIAEIVAFIK